MTEEEIDRNLIRVPKGSSYSKKNTYLLYRFTPETKFAPLTASTCGSGTRSRSGWRNRPLMRVKNKTV